jgi:ribonuclease HII
VPGLRVEKEWFKRGVACVAGVDEVGRGPLAGPVIAAVVVVPPGIRALKGVKDSKVMTSRRREDLAAAICRSLRYALGGASPREIDRYNIRQATALAMRRALARLGPIDGVIIVDGLPFPEIRCAHEAMVDGDAKCYSIACASIVAKTVRDRLMQRLAARYPGYGWEHNAGYGTRDHRDAIDQHGVTPHHRLSFTPVLQRELF